MAINPGREGVDLTRTMFVGMIDEWKSGGIGKATLKNTSAAFGISVPSLNKILKGDAMGKNTRKKIANAWAGISAPKKSTVLAMRKYTPDEITKPLWIEMIRVALGIKKLAKDGSTASGDIKTINRFFDLGQVWTRSILDQGYDLEIYDKHRISTRWNIWLMHKRTDDENIDAAPLVIVPLKDFTTVLFRRMIKTRLSVDLHKVELRKYVKAISQAFDVDRAAVLDMLEKNIQDMYWGYAAIRAWNLHVADIHRDKLKKTYRESEVTREVLYGMIRKMLPDITILDGGTSVEKDQIIDLFKLPRQTVDNLALVDLSTTDKEAIVDVWNKSDGGKKIPMDEKKTIAKLNDHAAGSGLAKIDYDNIEKWATEHLRQKKYRQSIFRGIKMEGHESEIIKIMADKSIKLSTFEGKSKHAESWTTDPVVAKNFAAASGGNRMYVVMEARPAPKEIVVYVNDSAVRYLESRDDIGKSYKNEILHYAKTGKEKEVIVRTGNRKYVLCRNIVFLNIPKKNLVNDYHSGGGHKINVLFPIVKRLKDNKNLERFQKDLTNRYTESYKFACGAGNFVYLASGRAVDTWMRKLASR